MVRTKTIQIKGENWIEIRARADRGTMVCLLPENLARRAGLDPPSRRYRIELESGGVRRMRGDMGLVRIDGKDHPTVLLVGDLDEPLLGMDALEHLGARTLMPRGRLKASGA